jgi:hypothetical protein
MSLGSNRMHVTAGGGRQRVSGAQLARAVVQMAVSTLGTPNVVTKISDPSGLATLLDAGQLPEAMAMRLRGGQTAYGMSIEPTVPGALGEVVHLGSGSGSVTVDTAPHKVVDIIIDEAGGVGTFSLKYRVGGTGNYSDPVVSVGPDPWVYRVPGTFCRLSFAEGIYAEGSTLSVGVDGVIVTSGGAATPGSVTSSVGPFHINLTEHWDVSIDEGTPQVFTFSGTQGFKTGSGAVNAGVAGSFVVRINEDLNTDHTITFAGSENSEALALAKINSQLIGATAIDATNQIKIRSDRYGTGSKVRIVSGTGALLTDLGFATGLGTAGTATVDKDGGGAVSKTIAFLDAATADELDTALVVTGASLNAVVSGPTAGALTLASSTAGGAPKGVQIKSASTNRLGFDILEHNGVDNGDIEGVTAESDPIDNYEVKLTVKKAGALGTAILGVSVDGGTTTRPPQVIPTSGKMVIRGTGLVLTCADDFVVDDTYAFFTAGPNFTTSDLTDALEALRSDRTFKTCLVHVATLPSSTADAFAAAEASDAAMVTAFDAGLDQEIIVECPALNDIVIDSAVAILDVNDTDAVIMAAREGLDLQRTSVFAGTHRMVSQLAGSGSMQLKRPLGWAVVDRYVDTEPRESVAALEPKGKLRITEIGRDEAMTPGLDDVQINTICTYRSRPREAYLSITSGGYGWKNLTTQDDFQDAEGVRALNVMLTALRVVADGFLGQKPPTNPDGTITEKKALAWDTIVDRAAKRSLGMMKGGDFKTPQASSVSASIVRSSQLGTTPRRLDINYTLQKLGFVSDVSGEVFYSGVLTVEG